MTAAIATRTVDALKRALTRAKDFKSLSDDPKTAECEKLLQKLIEHARLREALTAAVTARDETETNAILERGAAIEFTEAAYPSDQSLLAAKNWLKKLALARKRIATLMEARDSGSLTAAIATACEVGLEFDACVTDARAALKAWNEAISGLRAALDAQPFVTLPVLDAAIERATKSQLNEQTQEFVEATKSESAFLALP